jgi:hypothetical protein
MPVSTKVQVRRDNAATWTSQNPILAAGEIGFETDNLRFKIGNGSNTWANLAYQAAVFNGGTITNALVVSNTTGVNTSGQFTSTIATGTAPFTVSSTTRVANLNVATSGAVVTTVSGTTSAELVRGNMADNDQFRILVGGTATNAGFAEIATADDGTEPIHVRQYTGTFTTLVRTATLLDGSGNTTFPGTLSAVAKSFLIDHPTKPDMKLRHGSLEGPENGVYIRGTATDGIIELPEYWTKLVDAESITVSLTPIGKFQKVFVKEIRDNKVFLGGKNINCFFTVFAERKDIDKLVVEE